MREKERDRQTDRQDKSQREAEIERKNDRETDRLTEREGERKGSCSHSYPEKISKNLFDLVTFFCNVIVFLFMFFLFLCTKQIFFVLTFFMDLFMALRNSLNPYLRALHQIMALNIHSSIFLHRYVTHLRLRQAANPPLGTPVVFLVHSAKKKLQRWLSFFFIKKKRRMSNLLFCREGYNSLRADANGVNIETSSSSSLKKKLAMNNDHGNNDNCVKTEIIDAEIDSLPQVVQGFEDNVQNPRDQASNNVVKVCLLKPGQVLNPGGETDENHLYSHKVSLRPEDTLTVTIPPCLTGSPDSGVKTRLPSKFAEYNYQAGGVPSVCSISINGFSKPLLPSCK